MKKYISYEFLNYLFEKSQKSAALVFAVATTIFTFFSFEDMLDKCGLNTFVFKVLFLLLLCVIAVVISLISIRCSEGKPVIVFQKEKTCIQVQFGDMNKFIATNGGDKYTVVIPINTNIQVVCDSTIIRANSMHGLWLKLMTESDSYGTKDKTQISEEIKKEIINQIRTNKKGICKIGDFCYFKDVKKVNYLLVATCELLDDNTASCNEQQYYTGLQAMVEAIVDKCDNEGVIYIPVIGGGYANMEKTNQELLRQMIEILVFNSKKLQHEIHIVVYDKLKGDIQLSSLRSW